MEGLDDGGQHDAALNALDEALTRLSAQAARLHRKIATEVQADRRRGGT
ncbi:hypothetical protein [Caldimonas sp.]